MIDYHSHILPCMDDGSQSVEESLAMLDILKKAGFNTVVLSSHFYSNMESLESFLGRRAESYERLEAAAKGKNVPRTVLGAEVYLTSLLFNSRDLSPLTLGDSRIMLTELPYDRTLTAETRANLERLIYNRDITPVLAHIDRYPYLLDKKLLAELFEMGCKAQVNLDGFSGKRRRKLKKLVKSGVVFALGSDSHSPNLLAEGLEANMKSLSHLCGEGFADFACSYTKEILL